MTRRGIRITGVGAHVPNRVVKNEELTALSGISADWVSEKLGIFERRYCDDNQSTSDLAVEAAREAVQDGGLKTEDIDLIIVATATPDKRAPSTACIVQRKLGNHGCAAFDISAVCCGFLFAMTTAANYIRAGMYDNALVIGADTFSRVTDLSRRDNVFFGDGAGAALIQSTWDDDALFESDLMSLGAGEEFFKIDQAGSTFEMDGKGVFEAAISAVPITITRVLERARVTPADVDVVVPHQPSVSLLREIARRADLDFSRFVTNMDRYANTAGATIPIALHEAVRTGRLVKGNLVLFAAAGAGMTAGSSLLRW